MERNRTAERIFFCQSSEPGATQRRNAAQAQAERGRETLRHGPMKPVGLTNPHQPDIKALEQDLRSEKHPLQLVVEYEVEFVDVLVQSNEVESFDVLPPMLRN